MIPLNFPKMTYPPSKVSSLAWYPAHAPGLIDMQFEARGGEIVPLRYPEPQGSPLIGVPRTLAPEPTELTDGRSVGLHEFEAEFTSDLRPEQVPFIKGVFTALEEELGCIGEAPTGFGKTTASCNLITHIGRTTCIVVPKGDLDWEGELLKHTTIPEDRIDTWSGQRLPNPEAWVVIASLQSVYRLGHYPQEVYNRFGCLIIDEVHRVGSEEFSNVLRQFPAMWKLGLSATPDRRDGKMPLINAHMGWRHVIGKTDAEQPNYYVVPTEWMEPQDASGKMVRYDPARTNYAKRSLMADPLRNAKIAGAAYRAHNAGRRTIIFIEQIKHGERIKQAIRSMGVPARYIIEYNGGIAKAEKERVKECPEGLILIATYKYTAEGTNIPPLDCAIIAFPIWDPRQAVGRITRKLKGKATPIVIDIWDVMCKTLEHTAKKRWDYLHKLGAAWKGEFK